MKGFGVALLAVWMALCALVSAGEVEGRVEIKTSLRRRPTGSRHRFPRAPGQSDTSYDDKSSQATRDEVRNVVVFVLKAPARTSPPAPARMEQKGRQFIPFVLPVTVGTTVEFPNLDTIYHSVYSTSPARPIKLGEYPQGDSRRVTFDKPGIIELFCAIHSHMNAYILVLDNPYFAMPGADHHYRIEGLPAGRYVVKAWHPLTESRTQIVEVKAQGPVEANFSL